MSFPQVLDVPLTVKIRTGVQERVNLAHSLLPELRAWGATLVTVGLGARWASGQWGAPASLPNDPSPRFLLLTLPLLPVSLSPPLSPLSLSLSVPLSPHLLCLSPRVAAAVVSPQLHGRSREQRYTKLADWQYIQQCVKAASPMPLFGECRPLLSQARPCQRLPCPAPGLCPPCRGPLGAWTS